MAMRERRDGGIYTLVATVRLSLAAAVIIGALLFGLGWFARGWGVETDRRALQDSANVSRAASHLSDSLRLAAKRAYDAERAELSARVASLQLRARSLGTAATRLIDTVETTAPDTCLPGLARLRFAWSWHLEADSIATDATARVMRADSLELAAERDRTASVLAERDTAMARLDRALAMPGKKSGFLRGVVVGVVIVGGVALLAR